MPKSASLRTAQGQMPPADTKVSPKKPSQLPKPTNKLPEKKLPNKKK